MNKTIARILYKISNYILPNSYVYSRLQHKWIKSKTGFYFREKLAKSIFIECGENVNLERFASIGYNVKIGDNSGIGYKCLVASETTIGKNVMMGPRLISYNCNHKFDRLDIPMIEQGNSEIIPIVIGDDIWIGSDVTLLPGAKIGDGCVIGSHCVISKEIPPYSIVVGNPCKIIGNRIEKYGGKTL